MATAETTKGPIDDPDQIRERWLDRLGGLVEEVRGWAQEFGWAARVIQIRMRDSEIGKYMAPTLLLQNGKARISLEPIARSAPGAEGVVDLYLMPTFDDIGSLYYYDGDWQLHHLADGAASVATNREPEHRPLTRDSLGRILAEVVDHASESL